MIDPFTNVYQGILTALKAWSGVTNIVQPGNILDLSAENVTMTLKPQATDADTPELALLQGPFKILAFGTNSRSSLLGQSYGLMMTARNLNVVQVNALKYQVYIALLKSGDQLGVSIVDGATVYGNVTSWNITNGSDSPYGKPEWTRDTQRWFTAMSVNVEISLNRALISQQISP